MNHQQRMKTFHDKKQHQLGMGGEKKLAARKAAGRLNARERIDYFFDPGTFRELGTFTHSDRPGLEKKTPADGKITGFGLVNGRPVGAIANDMTILGASSASTNMKKLAYMKSISCEKGLPLVFLGESTGARMPDVMGSKGMGAGGQNTTQYRRLRESPWISVLMGHIYGSSSWYSALSDITIMQKGSIMAVSSPKVTTLATGEDTSPEELGGWKVHADRTGLVDALCETEEECMDLARKFLDFFPAHHSERAPIEKSNLEAPAGATDLLDLVPEESHLAYDMRNVVRAIFDGGDFLEIKQRFGKPCITGFARLKGTAVGVMGNNPFFGAGALDVDCCEKITSFLVLCDSFNLPIINLVDTPGFLIGKAGEQRKITGKIMNWMNALSLVTVPILTIITRKLYGQAYLNMGGGRYSDVFAAWPTADISFMGPEPAMNVVFNLKKEENPEEYQKLLGQIADDTEPWGAAGIFGVNEIIDPAHTREFLIQMMELHHNRKTGGIGNHLMNNWPTTF